MIFLKIMKVLAIVFTTLMLTMLNPHILAACPGCSAALTGSISRGFNMSILFLMAMPFFVVGSIVVGLVFVYRSKSNNHDLTSKENVIDNEKEEN
jgi:preprotein translocase subunit SecG